MTIYYIDPTFTGTKSGTKTEPFSSFAMVPKLLPGDSVLFKRGTTHIGQIFINASRADNATFANPITIGAYDIGDKPIISTAGFVIDVLGITGIIIQDLYLTATNSMCSGGIRLLNTGNCIIRRNTTSAKCDYGIRVDNNTTSVFDSITIEDNIIEGTWSNSGIAVLWGTSLGGYFRDVNILRNKIFNCGFTNLSGQGKGLFISSRVPGGYPITTNSGTIDKDCFASGIVVIGNETNNTRAHAISYNGVKTGQGEANKNIIAGNTFYKSGNGATDSHALWVGGSRDVLVEDNIVDNTTMMAGAASGTGIGIFVDGNDSFSGCKRVVVRRNKVSNTGLKPETSANTSEVAGAGIMALYSNDTIIHDNEITDCNNGIGILGWFGNGIKTNKTTIFRNDIKRIKKIGIYTGLGAEITSILNNYIESAEIGIGTDTTLIMYTEKGNEVLAKTPFSGTAKHESSINITYNL